MTFMQNVLTNIYVSFRNERNSFCKEKNVFWNYFIISFAFLNFLEKVIKTSLYFYYKCFFFVN